MANSEEKIRRRAYELGTKEGAAGMLKNTGSELKERLGRFVISYPSARRRQTHRQMLLRCG